LNHRGTEDTEKKTGEEIKWIKGGNKAFALFFFAFSVFVFSVSSVPLWFV
jgi:hypothetical protein